MRSEGSSPHTTFPAQVPERGREVPVTSGCKTSEDCDRVAQRLLETQAFLLKEQHTNLLGLPLGQWFGGPRDHREELGCGAPGEALGGGSLPVKDARRGHRSYADTHTHPSQS